MTPPSRGYAYMPIVAGGTALMYNLQIGGKRVTNLRLSGEVVAKIFTGQITKWNDKAIKADNPSLSLPDRAIVPVVRSDGSGSSAQFTGWMASQHSKVWNAYCASVNRATPCGMTSNYPVKNGSGFVSQAGSDGVSGYVKQTANIGTITYVEYSYALKSKFPVAKVLNQAGYYVEPTASNVAVGLLGAKINTTKGDQYLTQKLEGVYKNKDARAYPLSSYSYMIIPTSTQSGFTKAKGLTLGAFANYFLCEGQQYAESLGYSPLPINLVEAGLAQVKQIPGVEIKNINIKKCNNPTFSSSGKNTLAEKAPMPDACDKKGASEQCSVGTGGAGGTSNPGASGGTGSSSNDTGSTGGSGDTSDSGAGGDTSDTGAGTGGDAGVDGGAVGTSGGVLLGATEGGGPISCDQDTGVCANVVASPVTVAAGGGWGAEQTAGAIAIGLLASLILAPPMIARLIRERKRA